LLRSSFFSGEKAERQDKKRGEPGNRLKEIFHAHIHTSLNWGFRAEETKDEK